MNLDPFEVPSGEAAQVEFERKYVHSVYEKISAHFTRTRRTPWPVVEAYVRSGVPTCL